MYIEYTFKVNAFSVEKGVLSVTYSPVDETLQLKPYHVQQLGVDRQMLIDYSSGSLTLDQFKAKMRTQIVNADCMPQEYWNSALLAQKLVIPAEVNDMVGVEWSAVAESESAGAGIAMETL